MSISLATWPSAWVGSPGRTSGRWPPPRCGGPPRLRPPHPPRRDTVFIPPPQIFYLYTSDWRVFSERSTVATHSELLEAAFAPEYIEYWQPRFAAAGAGAVARFRGDFFENQRITGQAFYSLGEADFQRLAARYGAQYLVVEQPHEYDFPLVYENAGYRIYALRLSAGQMRRIFYKLQQ